jgi:hypothetical protein
LSRRAVPGARDNAKPCRRYRGRKRQALIPIAQVAVTKIRRHQNWQPNRLLMRRFGAKWKMIGADMKDVLSLATFAIGVLCFVVFVTTVKPDAISAAPASSKPEYCKNAGFWC